MGAQEIHRDHFPNIDEGGAVEKQYGNDRRRIEISSLTNRKNTIMLRGAMLFHRIGEYAILAVIAIALTNIPLSLLSGATMSRVTVHALSPAPCLAFGSSSQRLTFGVPNSPLHTKSAPLIPLKAADTTIPSTKTRKAERKRNLEIPRLDPSHLATLRDQGYVVVDDFLPSEDWMDALREDVLHLRTKQKFKIAKIGQDSTNALNEEIRVAETCFLGRDKPELRDVPNPAREKLYDVLETLRLDLQEGEEVANLDPNLSEFLYAYYPTGGFYRRHRDAVKGSASWLREYSLLLYLNEESYDPDIDGGRLRVHFDSGGDFLPAGEAPLFQDIDAYGGTLVIFESDKFPHEVMDTVAERFAVVGWYNRPMTLSDLSAINDSGGGGGAVPSLTDDPVRLVALAVAAGLITVGLLNILA